MAGINSERWHYCYDRATRAPIEGSANAGHQHKILLLEPDPDLLELLVAELSLRFDAQVTCVSSPESCIDAEMAGPHDLIIAEMCASPGPLRLTETLTAMSSRPIILLGDAPTCREAIAALRMGVRELLIKPFPVEQLSDAAARLLYGLELHRRHLAKYRRMRGLVRRVIRERRNLNQRIELICRDLVGAHRRLVNRVLDVDGNHPTQTHNE